MSAANDPRWLFPTSTGPAAGAADDLGRAAATILDTLIESIATRAAELVGSRITPEAPKPGLLTLAAAADELGVDVKTLKQFIGSGQLQTRHGESGREWVTRGSLDRFQGVTA